MLFFERMKKKQDGAAGTGVDVYNEGERHGLDGVQSQAGQYKGHYLKCYRNGYVEGQRHRAAQKRSTLQP